jgi:hypothetical protein
VEVQTCSGALAVLDRGVVVGNDAEVQVAPAVDLRLGVCAYEIEDTGARSFQGAREVADGGQGAVA